jgi:hypothetical protein
MTDPGPLRSFDPVRVGRLECDAWVAYYRRQWPRLLLVSVLLVHRAFRLDWPRTLHGAWLVARANQLWAPDPDALTGLDTDPLVTALARLYAYLYRTDEEAVRPAARLRAAAMDLSDRWIDEGRAPDSPLIPAVRATLVRSYAALLAAVHA